MIGPAWVGTLLCVASALGYGSVNLLLRRMAVRYDPLWIIWLKETITIVPLMPYLLWLWARGQGGAGGCRSAWGLVLVGLLTNTVATPGLVWAMGVVGVAIAVPASLGINLVACAALGRVYLGERVTAKTALAVALLILSVTLLSAGAQHANASLATAALAVGPAWVAVAVIASALAGAVYAALNVVIRQAAGNGVAIGAIAFLVPAMGSVALGPVCLWRFGLEGLLAAASEDLALMLACGLLNLLAFLAIIHGLRRTSVVHANVLAASQAAIAAVGGLVFFGEAASPALALGVSLTILGMLLLDPPQPQGSPKPLPMPYNTEVKPASSNPPQARSDRHARRFGYWAWLAVAVAAVVAVVAAALFCQRWLGQAHAAASSLRLEDIPFDGQQAYEDLKRLCALGPRPSGSAGMRAQQRLLREHFEALGAQVRLQEFTARHPVDGSRVPMANLIVTWHPDSRQRILLCAHYDTLPLPMLDPVDPRGVFVGANDGASGTALLMELGREMPRLRPRLGVDFVFFDGEEFIFSEQHPYFLGSEYFARQYRDNPPPYRYRFAVLLDMVGDADLQIYQEQNSMWWRDTRPLVLEIWAVARRLGVREFIPRIKHEIRDDHLPLHNLAGIPACVLIDFDYPVWHTRQDTPEQCSALSLAKVGWVLRRWLERAK